LITTLMKFTKQVFQMLFPYGMIQGGLLNNIHPNGIGNKAPAKVISEPEAKSIM